MTTPELSLANPKLQEFCNGMFENLKAVLRDNFPLIPKREQNLDPIVITLPDLEGPLSQTQAALWQDREISIERPRVGPDTVASFIAVNLPLAAHGIPERVCFDVEWDQKTLAKIFFQSRDGENYPTTEVWRFGNSSEMLQALRRSSPGDMLEKLLILDSALAKLAVSARDRAAQS